MVSLTFLLPIVILSFASPFSLSEALEIKWCHKVEDAPKCTNLTNADPSIKCVSAPNIYRCMEMVKDGSADVLYVSDTELYSAGKTGLKPLLQVVHKDSSDFRYKAVAVVKVNGTVKKLADLSKAKSCHTAAGKTTGWTVPVSNLIQMKLMPTSTDCYSSAKNVGAFFKGSCVPGVMTKRYNPFSQKKPNPEKLCDLCKDKENPCSTGDAYAGYDGAKKCLMENPEADIAFVKHETMKDADKTKYKLLCPNDKLMEVDEYEQCNWAVRPSDTIVVTPEASNSDEIAQHLINNVDKLVKHLDLDSVVSLKKTSLDYSKIMGEGFKNTFEYYHTCDNQLRWCTISDAEFKKCTDLKLAFTTKRATNKLECVKAVDHFDCMAKIEQKKADFVVLDGGDLEIAMNNCKLEPVIAENYGHEIASYFTVAVVKATSKFNIKQLKGKKSCHTGIGKTSGWKSPISYLIKNKYIPKGHSIPEEVGKFFSESCVPGALQKEYNPDGHNPKNLCALCPKDHCERNSDNKYYDYSGAFRCLVEAGEVAFVKHTTVNESTDGKGTEDWEMNLKSSDYQLLCKDGTRASVTDWQKCHLAKVPSHAMVVRKGEKELAEQLYEIFNNFDLSSPESKKLLFTSDGGKNLLFKDSTESLIYIGKPETFLGSDYLEILEYFGVKSKVCSGSSRLTISVTLVLFSLVNYFA